MDPQEKSLHLVRLLVELLKVGFPVNTAIQFIRDNYLEFLNLIQEADKSGTVQE